MIEMKSAVDVLIPVTFIAIFVFMGIGWWENRHPGATEKEIAASRRTSFFMKVFTLLDVSVLIVLIVSRFVFNLW